MNNFLSTSDLLIRHGQLINLVPICKQWIITVLDENFKNIKTIIGS